MEITYGEQDRGICIRDNSGTFFDAKRPIDPTKIVWKPWLDVQLPFLFDASGKTDFFEVTETRLTINYDLIASAFYLLSGWHEFVSEERDRYGRFPYRASIQHELGIVQLPVVNYYFDILKDAIEQFYDISLPFRLNGAFPFYIAVTHDIDNLHSGWLEEGFAALKKGRLASAFSLLIHKAKGKDLWNNLDTLLAFEHRRGITASYYFLPSQGMPHQIPHADYEVTDAEVTAYMEAVKEAGSEIGIHGPVGSHLKSDNLKKYLSLFDSEIAGGRFHYLAFEPGVTPQVLERAGLRYDSTLGFAEHTGFRNSFAHPFYLFDLENRRPTSVLEIPLVIMDQTLSQKKYMGIPPERAVEHVYPLLEEIRKFNGAAAILWHNNFFSSIKFGGWEEVLSDMISYGKQHGGAMGSVQKLIECIDRS